MTRRSLLRLAELGPADFRTPTALTSPEVSWRFRDGAIETNPRRAAAVRSLDGQRIRRIRPLVRMARRTGRQFGDQVSDTEVRDRSPAGADSPLHASGALYNYLAPVERRAKPAGEWNCGRLAVSPDEIEHWVNNRRVLAFRLDAPELKTALAARNLASARMLERLARRRTPIAFQHHESAAASRRMRIAEPGVRE